MNTRVKLTRQYGEQVIHIPVGMELPGDEAVISKDGDRIVIETAPTAKGGWLAWLATQEPIEDEFPETEDRPAEPFEL